jgi:hypothetical protein
MQKGSTNYFHCYATANDQRHYYRDIQNLLRIRNTISGMSKLQLYIAISEVHTKGFFDKIFVWCIRQLFHKHSDVELKSIFFKSNVGRDFSSYAMMNDLIQQESSPNDYIFFQNRSGYGPFRYHSSSVIATAIKTENRILIIDIEYFMRKDIMKFLSEKKIYNFDGVKKINNQIIKELKYEKALIYIRNNNRIKGAFILVSIVDVFIKNYKFRKNIKIKRKNLFKSILK